MAQTSARLAHRIRQDFSGQVADDVVRQLADIPESLARADWRDVLMDTSLEHGDWPTRLDELLGG